MKEVSRLRIIKTASTVLAAILLTLIFNPFLNSEPEIAESKARICEYEDNSQKILSDNLALFEPESMSSYFIGTSASSEKRYIAKIVSARAETFTGSTRDDYSRPTNSYLPKGTVDYCYPQKITDPESGKKYYLMAGGYRVYAKDSTVKLYKGTLPSKNSVKVSKITQSGNKLKLKFSLKFKAPFRVTLGKQEYKNPKTQEYQISTATFTYLDIKFLYSNKFSGKIELPKNSLFKKAKVLKSDGCYKLRLYLKKKGMFYGWDSYYNSSGELVFSFLLPTSIYKDKTNSCGYSLKGTTIVVDAGHGGTDPGALSYTGSAKYCEKYYTLLYAKYLRKELKKLGARVVMTRTSDEYISLSKRRSIIRQSGADLAVSIHFNACERGSPSGYFMGYFYPFTKSAASYLSKAVYKSNTLKRYNKGIDWHYFNLSRESSCPVVLTENGFLDNYSDYSKLRKKEFCKKYVKALTKGIINYFRSISVANPSKLVVITEKVEPKPQENSSSSSSSTVSSAGSSTVSSVGSSAVSKSQPG